MDKPKNHGAEIWARRQVTVDEARVAVAAALSLRSEDVYTFDMDEEYALKG